MRHSILYGLIIPLMTIMSSMCYGQKTINPKTDTVKWVYGKGENKARGSEALSISGHFISYSDKQFLWVQNGTDRKYSFAIKSVKGEWTNTNEHGELLYRAVCNDVDGTIRLYKDKKEIGIEIDFTTAGKLTPNLLLTINSHSKN